MDAAATGATNALEERAAPQPAPETGDAAPGVLGQDGCLVRTYRLKRMLDIGVSAIALLLLFPLFVLIAGCIRLTDGGPAIFWQRRVGLNGRVFWFPKFRSMRVGSEHLHDSLLALNDHRDSITFKMRNDPRMTPIGRMIRSSSIDELPQLWSVLKGDMSLVGPRPPLPSEAARYTSLQRRRLAAKPGLTCIWQVSGRSTIPFQRQVEMDIEYVEKQSLWLDLELICRTIPAILSCKGAY